MIVFLPTKACLNQCCQPPIFGADICAKAESNPECLRKSLHQTNPILWILFSTKPFLRQNHEIVKLQLGHVIIGMIPATASMHKIHAIDHKNIVNKSLKSSFISPRQTERETEIMDEIINSKHKQPFSQ